jgi:hypothetical protein
MGEYEDRYPDAYGHGEVIDRDVTERHFTGIGLPRQTRDQELPADRTSNAAPRPAQPKRVRREVVPRPPGEIAKDVSEQLSDSPFIDASDVTVSVEGYEVTLEGTINNLIAISLAQALASNTPGVSRVQVRLRVRQSPRIHEAAGAPLYPTNGRQVRPPGGT